MAKRHSESGIIDLPRSQWRYVQAAPPVWLVLALLAGIILGSLWWGIVSSQPKKVSSSSAFGSSPAVMVVSGAGGRDG